VKKILVVDDEPNILTMVKYRLMANNYEVFTAETAKEGLELAQSVKPDAIILDIVLPDMDGSEVAQALLDDKATKDIPVIFLTALISHKEILMKTHNIAGHYFLAKPFKSEELLDRLAQIFEET
jgi:DNA-binding response OmpR family regulator